jgi:hypothetical protein
MGGGGWARQARPEAPEAVLRVGPGGGCGVSPPEKILEI